MAKKYAGLVSVGYADTVGGAYTTITGKLTPDSAITVENILTDTTDTNLYGGQSLTLDIGFLDRADYATLEGFMTADTEKFWKFTFIDDATETTSVAFPIQVKKINATDKRTGLASFRLTAFKANDTPVLTSA